VDIGKREGASGNVLCVGRDIVERGRREKNRDEIFVGQWKLIRLCPQRREASKVLGGTKCTPRRRPDEKGENTKPPKEKQQERPFP